MGFFISAYPQQLPHTSFKKMPGRSGLKIALSSWPLPFSCFHFDIAQLWIASVFFLLCLCSQAPKSKAYWLFWTLLCASSGLSLTSTLTFSHWLHFLFWWEWDHFMEILYALLHCSLSNPVLFCSFSFLFLST